MKRFLSLLLVLSMCATCIALAEEEVSLEKIWATEPPPEETQAQTQEETKPVNVREVDGSILLTMSFTGDVTIGGDVRKSGKSIFDKELDKQKGDITFPFRNVRDLLTADDLTIVNFEGTLTTAKINSEKKENAFLFSAPPEYVQMLPAGGIESVSLENNHVLDHGEDGLTETKRVLTDAGLTYASEDEPAVMTVKTVKIGSLAYQTFNNQYPRLYEKVPADIQALRDEGCQIVIVSYHWGDEMDYKPNDNQQKLAKLTIDSGADLVIGHHSHRINPIEEYNGKYICYSLGNFSFAGNTKPSDMSTYIFQTKFRVKDGAVTPEGFIIIPCRISSRTDYNDFTPTPYTKEQSIESVLTVLKKNGESLENPVSSYPLQWVEE